MSLNDTSILISFVCTLVSAVIEIFEGIEKKKEIVSVLICYNQGGSSVSTTRIIKV